MIHFLFLLSLFQSQAVEKEISYINLSSSAHHKVVLEPDKHYDISCSLSSFLAIELSKPGSYYIKWILCSDSSHVHFLKPLPEWVRVHVGLLSAIASSSVNIETISQCVSINKEIVKTSSQIVRGGLTTK